MMAIKIFLIVFGILLAAFFAGAETGIYRMSRFNLRIGIEKKQRFFRLYKLRLKKIFKLTIKRK